jgi:mannose/cellobiose epimerase-like protein (N-acyl-D-glucosamine 2-epimerase family)
MNFYDINFIKSHCQSILDFYNPRIIDKSGGFYQNYHDDGEIFNPKFRQLVSSTRMVVNYAQASIILNRPDYADIARHGLAYVENVHWQNDKKVYAWTLNNHQPEDLTQQSYGYAFILLMYACVKEAGIIESEQPLLDIYQLLEQRFWQADDGLYADEIAINGELSDYRGQNSNMHLCEAMIAAFEATNNQLFLDRAMLIASNIVQRQAGLSDNLVWEHYTKHFQPDWEYNKDDPKNLYRPWGFQPGHQTEWTKLLLKLNQHQPQPWLVNSAKYLFDRSFDLAWDKEHGGLIYGFDRQGNWCDDDKYFWVQAESFAAAALLYKETHDSRYLSQYLMLWQYSWQHMIDHKYGAWFRVLNRDNSKQSTEKSAAGAKCDYHSLISCFEVIKTL